LGFSDREYRKELLTEFLDLVAQCAAAARLQGNLEFSCDAPWWFYAAASPAREEVSVKYKGQEKTVGEHLTDLLPSVTIMDYRNEADGAAGIIQSGVYALAYAASAKKRIVIGLETFSEADALVDLALALPEAEFHQKLGMSGLRDARYFEDFALFALKDGTRIDVVPRSTLGTRQGFGRAGGDGVCPLAQKLGFVHDPCCSTLAPTVASGRAVLAGDPEWGEVQTLQLSDPETHYTFAGFRTTHHMAPGTTFYGLGSEVFNEETRSLVEWLSPYPSFGGLALHFYDSLRSLLGP